MDGLMKGKFLVFLQFFLIFLMILPIGASTNTMFYGLLVSGLGIVVGLLALSINRLGNFNIHPDLKEDGTLVTTGIYAYIRHPMYTSVLLSMLGIVLIYPMPYEYVLYGLLVLTLLVKLFYEEHLWKCESSEYIGYCRNTKRIIPYIF